MLQHLLREETIRLGIDSANHRTALKELIHSLPSWALRPQQRQSVYELVMRRERFGTTAIGDGIALPHCIFSGVSFPLAALGVSRDGLAFPSLDGEPVHLIFLLILPEQEDAAQSKQRILMEAETLFRDRFVRERIKIAETEEEVFELVQRESLAHSPALNS